MASGGVRASPPDGGWGWMVVLGVGIMHFFLIGIGRSVGVLYLVLRDRYDGSATETAWLLTLFNVVRTICAPLCGMLCDRFGCRRVATCGGIIASGGLVLSAFATSLSYLYLSFSILAGIGGSMTFTSGYIIVSQYFLKKKGKAMALATVGSGLGHMIISPAIVALVDAYGFTGAMLILGGLMMHTCIGAGLYRPLRELTTTAVALTDRDVAVSTPGDEGAGDDVAATAERAEDPAATSLMTADAPAPPPRCPRLPAALSDYAALLTDPTYLLYGGLIAAMAVCIQGYLMFLPDFAMERGATEEAAAFAPSFMAFADMCGRIAFGFLYDLRAVRPRRPVLHAVIGILFGAFTLLTATAASYVVIAVVAVAVGLVESAVHSQRMTVAADIVAPERMSAAVSLAIFFQGVGTLIGPTVSGILRDKTGTSEYGFYFIGLLMVFCSAVFLVYYLYVFGWQRERPKTESVELQRTSA